jgi:general secretion pathway protein E
VTASIEAFSDVPEGPGQYPIEFIERRGVILLEAGPDEVVAGVVDDADAGLRALLRAFHGRPVRTLRIERSDLAAYLARRTARGLAGGVGGAFEPGHGDDGVTVDRLADDAPVVNYVSSLLLAAIRRGASDVHIERFTSEAVVRQRIDGRLRTVDRFPPERSVEVASRIKVMANLNIMERRLPQDGRVTLEIEGLRLDVRVSIVPIARGESIVLRLFNREDRALALEALGFDEEQVALLRRWTALPHGLVVVTGPTGSGKSTTLSSMLRIMRTGERKIVTIEDPIEHVLDGVDQIQTDERIGLTFGALLRRVLRQDPDVIMVGEIRDEETAELACRAALTGHLVLTTLHTVDSAGVVTRLRNMGIPPYVTASVLRGVLAQRLLRRVCEACEGRGCARCEGTGYHGRFAVGEMVQADDGIASLIQEGASEALIRDAMAKRGIAPLSAAARRAADRGITSRADADSVEAS